MTAEAIGIAEGHPIFTTVRASTLDILHTTAPDRIIDPTLSPDERLQHAIGMYVLAWDTLSGAPTRLRLAHRLSGDAVEFPPEMGNSGERGILRASIDSATDLALTRRVASAQEVTPGTTTGAIIDEAVVFYGIHQAAYLSGDPLVFVPRD